MILFAATIVPGTSGSRVVLGPFPRGVRLPGVGVAVEQVAGPLGTDLTCQVSFHPEYPRQFTPGSIRPRGTPTVVGSFAQSPGVSTWGYFSLTQGICNWLPFEVEIDQNNWLELIFINAAVENITVSVWALRGPGGVFLNLFDEPKKLDLL